VENRHSLLPASAGTSFGNPIAMVALGNATSHFQVQRVYMILLIDIGNTSIKWGTLDKGHVNLLGRSFYQNHLSATKIITHWQTLPQPKKVLISNVAAKTTGEQIQTILQQLWNLTPIFIQENNEGPAALKTLKTQSILGVDRWLALLALNQTETQPFATIGCGTAITIDVCQNNAHQGGLIAPGIELMRLSLIEHTAGCRLRPQQKDKPSLLAFDTDGAMRAGSLQMALAFIETTLEKIEHTLNVSLKIFITGGDAERLMPYFQKPTRFIAAPSLVLNGLALFV
jgi:type III pantothenate kinase